MAMGRKEERVGACSKVGTKLRRVPCVRVCVVERAEPARRGRHALAVPVLCVGERDSGAGRACRACVWRWPPVEGSVVGKSSVS